MSARPQEAMPLLCELGWHRPDPLARWNDGYYFSKCTRCGRDLVRTAYGQWQVPKGYRVVWQQSPPATREEISLVPNGTPEAAGAPSPPSRAPIEADPAPEPETASESVVVAAASVIIAEMPAEPSPLPREAERRPQARSEPASSAVDASADEPPLNGGTDGAKPETAASVPAEYPPHPEFPIEELLHRSNGTSAHQIDQAGTVVPGEAPPAASDGRKQLPIEEVLKHLHSTPLPPEPPEDGASDEPPISTDPEVSAPSEASAAVAEASTVAASAFPEEAEESVADQPAHDEPLASGDAETRASADWKAPVPGAAQAIAAPAVLQRNLPEPHFEPHVEPAGSPASSLSQPEASPEPEAAAQPEPVSQHEPGPSPEPQPQPPQQPVTEAEREPEPQPQPVAEAERKPAPRSQAQPVQTYSSDWDFMQEDEEDSVSSFWDNPEPAAPAPPRMPEPAAPPQAPESEAPSQPAQAVQEETAAADEPLTQTLAPATEAAVENAPPAAEEPQPPPVPIPVPIDHADPFTASPEPQLDAAWEEAALEKAALEQVSREHEDTVPVFRPIENVEPAQEPDVVETPPWVDRIGDGDGEEEAPRSRTSRFALTAIVSVAILAFVAMIASQPQSSPTQVPQPQPVPADRTATGPAPAREAPAAPSAVLEPAAPKGNADDSSPRRRLARTSLPALPGRELAFVSASVLQCRSAPVDRAAPVRKLVRGAQVQILAREGQWASVAHKGRQCWAAARFLSAAEPW